MNPSSSAAAQAGEPALPATGGATPEQPTMPGLTAPTRRGGATKRIGEVIVNLGFADAESVEAAVTLLARLAGIHAQIALDSQIVLISPPRESCNVMRAE